MQPKKVYLKAFSLLVIAALLVACGSPAAAPTATSVPPTPTSIPPTATPVPPTPEPPPVAEEPAAAAAEPEAAHGIRFDAPEYAIDGPYAVGVRYFTIPAAAE
ncbi:MAG TPA: hypothetical protein P5148_15585, partial [Anaerolineae bacterium]|nr:hypothetical protein [Anaerolineae bacterium]